MKLMRGAMVKFSHDGEELAGRVMTSGEKRSKVAVDGAFNNGNFAVYDVVNTHTDPATEVETLTLLHVGDIPDEYIKVEGCHRC